jgi:hypothetical protein
LISKQPITFFLASLPFIACLDKFLTDYRNKYARNILLQDAPPKLETLNYLKYQEKLDLNQVKLYA